MGEQRKVLFLCTGNSCRSQMAEGFLKKLGKDSFKVVSAGTYPSQVHTLAIKVMKEKNIDISKQTSKNVNQFLNQHFDNVITLCDSARQSCPIFPGKYQHFHWDLEDPAAISGDEERKLKKFREIRDQIEENIKKYIKQKDRE